MSSSFFLHGLMNGLLALSALFSQASVQQQVVETGRIFQWAEVSNAQTNPDLGNLYAEVEPWYINLNSLMVQGEIVIFEATSPDAQYVLFRGHCQSYQIRTIYVGEFLDASSIRYHAISDEWHPAIDWQSALLGFACTQ